MYLCDTDFLVGLIRSDKRALDKLEELLASDIVLCTTHLNACELFKGAYRSSKQRKSVGIVHKLLEGFEILPFSLESDEAAGRILSRLFKKGKPIGDIDTIIASIAQVNQATILTNNIKHFQLTNVRLESWSS